MRAFRYPIALVVVVGLCALTAWIMAWPFAKAVILAPVIVCGGAALVALVLLWGKVAVTQVRESRNPRRVVAYWLIGLGLLALLTVLGVKLPSETGH